MIARLASLVLIVFSASAAAQEVPLRNDAEKTLYAVGLMLAEQLETLKLNRREFPYVVAGLSDAVLGREKRVDVRQYREKVAEFQLARAALQEMDDSKEFLKKAAAEAGAVVTESGLVFRELARGSGRAPTAESTVRMHYQGMLRTGRVFDTTRMTQPATLPLKTMIPCWREGLLRMRTGGRAKLTCPAELAYGIKGSPPHILPGAAVAYQVELLDVKN